MAMNHPNPLDPHAFVVPADPAVPTKLIDWPWTPHTEQDTRTTLGLLYAEIGCDCIDATPMITTGLGVMIGWSDDTSLLQDAPRYNDRAIALCRMFGYMVPALAGTIVFTGGPDPIGDTQPLTPELAAALVDTFAKIDPQMAKWSTP
jgi:hypothetical protein